MVCKHYLKIGDVEYEFCEFEKLFPSGSLVQVSECMMKDSELSVIYIEVNLQDFMLIAFSSMMGVGICGGLRN